MIACGGRWHRRGATLVVALVVALLEMTTVIGPSAAVTSNDKMNGPGPAVATTLAADGVTPAPKITVFTGSPVIDQATVSGVARHKRGRIAYLVFSDPNCNTLVFDATPSPNRVRKGVVPASKAFVSVSAGVFYWVAVFSRGKGNNENDDNDRNGDEDNAQVGDEDNDDDDNDVQIVAKSPCGDEQLTVVEPAHLLVKKHVINDNGGVKTAADFRITVTGGDPSPPSFGGSESGTTVTFRTLTSVTYSVDEAAAEGYSKSLSSGCTGTIAANESKTCTITNDDIAAPAAPRLTVIKHVINDSGGLAKAGDWQMTITNNGAAQAPFAGTEAGTTRELTPGSYSVAESGPAGYTASFAGCTGTIAAGEQKICTITNDDQPAHLTVIKQVVNDNGGTKQPKDFQITVTGTAPNPATFPGSAAGTDVTLGAGAYSVDEALPAGYAKTRSSDCAGTLALAETKTCTITNDDNPPLIATLTVIKRVVNDNGGTALAGAWQMTVTSNGTPMTPFPGSAAGTDVTLGAGTYSVAESGGPAGYTATLSASCTGTIAAGEQKTCTITNDDQSAHLTVIKTVINDNGGTKLPKDFQITVTGNGPNPASFPGSLAGTDVTLGAGAFSVDEAPVTGYTQTGAVGCTGTLALAEIKVCTITNDDQPAHLTVIKTVINDNGGTNRAGDFTLHLLASAGGSATFTGVGTPGTTLTFNAGNYQVLEDQLFGYLANFSPDCSGTIAVGQTKSCTVTNDDQVIVVSVATTLSGGGLSGASIRVPPGLSATDQATLSGVRPSAGGTISYKVYSDSACSALVFDATPAPNTVLNGAAPASKAFSSNTVSVFYWQAVYSGDANNAGATSVCADEQLTFAPSDAALLIVKKHVINDSGGSDATRVANDFLYQIQDPATGGGITGFIHGSETGTLFELVRGSAYRVVEVTNPAPTYALTLSADCSGTIQAGDVKTCTLTNDDIAPAKLTVIKHVLNNDGGTSVDANFVLQVQTPTGAGLTGFFGGSEAGTLFELPRGSDYKVVEVGGPTNYLASFEITCTGTLPAGANVSCTVTNDDLASSPGG